MAADYASRYSPGALALAMPGEKVISSEFLLGKLLDKIHSEDKTINSPYKEYLARTVYQDEILNEDKLFSIVHRTTNPLEEHKETKEEKVFGYTLYSPTEDLEPFSELQSRLRKYIDLDIKKVFGINIIEYFNLTVYEVESMNKIAKEFQDALAKAEKEQQKKIEEEARKREELVNATNTTQ